MGSMAKAQAGHELLFWERSPPLAILAAAEVAQVSIEVKVDPKFTKDSLPILLLHSDRYRQRIIPQTKQLQALLSSENLRTSCFKLSNQGGVRGGSINIASVGQNSKQRQCVVWSQCPFSCAGQLQGSFCGSLQCCWFLSCVFV